MNTAELVLKRKGISFLLYLFLLFTFICLMSFFRTGERWSDLLYVGTPLVLFYLFYPLMQFTVEVKEDALIINRVSTLRYEDIQKAYVGTFSFIESFESVDKLPLTPFKDKRLTHFFQEKRGKNFPSNVFLVLHTPKGLFFVKADYFSKTSFLKVLNLLKEKNIPMEIEENVLKEKMN